MVALSTHLFLAISLVLLSLDKAKISYLFLLFSLLLGYMFNIINATFIMINVLVFIIAILYQYKKFFILEVALFIYALALFLHFIPGVNNIKVLDQVYASTNSAPFNLYFSIDKPLGVFILFLLFPILFKNTNYTKASVLKWGLLFLSPILLLCVPWYLDVIKLEISLPSWILYFLFSNLLLVALVEEAFFRGYLQQRLTQFIHPNLALLIASIAFGLVHYKSGVLMIVFASIAGLIYGLAYKYSKSLWSSVLFHYGLNLIHLVFFTYPFYLKH
ncbi:lysostaphin resistance A-like protein [Campylobacter lari]|uniref:CPBP family intramembrane glutamic endopeptidase n=1 Tax=Campylobacter lari TaxID=201 RepID=UPI00087478B4|nr:CPBP family intramembrane glutamic endopeptidase [Campylobacter lari]EAH5177515.1 CPBP family intramembrane metalloprotease [Campylobacter lari]EAH5178130.1 CPBP family intramembrane metalloprotease [Campylobacter lari]EAH6292538.1 CPBP family intramembrane metalloprotease [Campylobacter lari]EAH6293358.1 CPBP family intramembrane metalloprotease [Campylobacter lari]EAH7187664.1 CPBP family intramembrane metalloprotease [Campylobacter lari]